MSESTNRIEINLIYNVNFANFWYFHFLHQNIILSRKTPNFDFFNFRTWASDKDRDDEKTEKNIEKYLLGK